jgi:hypothetical protein
MEDTSENTEGRRDWSTRVQLQQRLPDPQAGQSVRAGDSAFLRPGRAGASREARRRQDAVLIYEVLQITQERRKRSSDGLSETLANKTLSSLLRHWRVLAKHVPDYDSCRAWESRMMLYRFGAVVYQEPGPWAPHGKNPFNVWFLQDLILHDPVLIDLGATVMVRDPLGSRHRTYLAFPPSSLRTLTEYESDLDVPRLDASLARMLADVYSRLPAPQVYAVSSCPTAESTVDSITAELRMWHHDWKDILKWSEPYAQYTKRSAADALARALDRAYVCTTQAQSKRNLYMKNTAQARQALQELSLSYTDGESVIAPFAAAMGDGTPTDEINTMVELATDLRTLTAWVYVLLRQIGLLETPSRVITDRETDLARQHTHRLANLGLAQRRTKLEDLALRLDLACLPEFHSELVEVTHILEDVLAPAGATFNRETILNFLTYDPDIAAPTSPTPHASPAST